MGMIILALIAVAQLHRADARPPLGELGRQRLENPGSRKVRGTVLQTGKPGRRKVALVTGITGQDGSYLAELLLEKGYEVHGVTRRSSYLNTGRIDPLLDVHQNLQLHYGDLADSGILTALLLKVSPDEVYNLGAMSHVKVSFDMPVHTGDIDGLGTMRLLEAIQTAGLGKITRFYQASTSEMFGKVQEIPQTETTPFYPRSPYGVAKLYAYWTVKNQRESYGIHASNGILFNHESPRRGANFVTRKITRAVAQISLGQLGTLVLGNLDASRDWGHARDYVRMMWMMLQVDEPDDYVIATGEGHTVREFVEASFGHVGVDIAWDGTGTSEVGRDRATGVVRVRVSEEFFRPAEVDFLLGNSSKAKTKLGWVPSITFEKLCAEMVQADVELFKSANRSSSMAVGSMW